MSFIWGEINWVQNSFESYNVLKEDILRYPYDDKHEVKRKNAQLGLLDVALRKSPFHQNKIIEDHELGISLVGDIRLDYRADLLNKLRLNSEKKHFLSDTEFVYEAYKKWGVECTNYLEGDWAFVIVFWKKNEVFLARDPMGLRPLFFYKTNKFIVFSTSLQGIRNLENVSNKPSEAFWKNRFFGAQTAPFSTPFKEIKQVPPAYKATIDNKRVNFKQYFEWDFTSKPVRNKNAAIELKSKIVQAIESRTYEDFPIGLKLSGGLDSTAILEILIKSQKKQKPFCATSIAPENYKGTIKDENSWIEKLQEFYPEIPFFKLSKEKKVTNFKRYAELLSSIHFRRLIALEKELELELFFENNDCKTVHTGWFGDHFVSANYLLDSKELYKYRSYKEIGRTALSLVSFKKGKRQAFKKLINSKKDYSPVGTKFQYLFKDEFIKDLSFEAHDSLSFTQKWKENLGLKHRPRLFLEDSSFLRNNPFYLLHPFTDVRLIKFIQSLHPLDLHSEGVGRGLFKNALKDILPTFILNRRSKGGFYHHEDHISDLVKEFDLNLLNSKNAIEFLDWFNLEQLKNEIKLLKMNVENKGKVQPRDRFLINLIGYICFFKQ